MNLPPTKYVKTSSRPSVPPQLTPPLSTQSNNPPPPPPPKPKAPSFVSSSVPEFPTRKQTKVVQPLGKYSTSTYGSSRFRIPPSPRKRATPKPAFGRFVSPTGSSKTDDIYYFTFWGFYE